MTKSTKSTDRTHKTQQDDLTAAMESDANLWYARANGASNARKSPVCRLMEKIAKKSGDTGDVCLECPISKYNNDMGCPDIVQQYAEEKKADERLKLARRVAEFIEEANVAYNSGRYT